METLISLLFLVASIAAMEHYQLLIPNGKSVPNPCISGTTWLAVGHYNPTHHTHDKNPFGKAFAAAGHTWTQSLCKADSDSDGKTNGEELGDPNCTWTEGGTPEGQATGHPGLCEPVSSPECNHDHFYCNCHGHNCIGK